VISNGRSITTLCVQRRCSSRADRAGAQRADNKKRIPAMAYLILTIEGNSEIIKSLSLLDTSTHYIEHPYVSNAELEAVNEAEGKLYFWCDLCCDLSDSEAQQLIKDLNQGVGLPSGFQAFVESLFYEDSKGNYRSYT